MLTGWTSWKTSTASTTARSQTPSSSMSSVTSACSGNVTENPAKPFEAERNGEPTLHDSSRHCHPYVMADTITNRSWVATGLAPDPHKRRNGRWRCAATYSALSSQSSLTVPLTQHSQLRWNTKKPKSKDRSTTAMMVMHLGQQGTPLAMYLGQQDTPVP